MIWMLIVTAMILINVPFFPNPLNLVAAGFNGGILTSMLIMAFWDR